MRALTSKEARLLYELADPSDPGEDCSDDENATGDDLEALGLVSTTEIWRPDPNDDAYETNWEAWQITERGRTALRAHWAFEGSLLVSA